MKILIAGGAGFIGRNFVQTLLGDPRKEFSRIFVIDKLTYASTADSKDSFWSDKRIQFIHDDVLNISNHASDFKGVDLAVNFAAESHVDRSIKNHEIFIKNNIEGAVSFYDFCYSFAIPRIIQISTDEVYGSIEFGEATTSHDLLPNSPYSASKASADLIARSFNETYGKRIMITRCTNNYGFFQHPEKFIPKAICSLLSGANIQVYGNGENSREWIHVQDHVAGILKVANLGKVGEVYNFGSGMRLTNIQLAQKICHLMNFPLNSISYIADRPGHDLRYAVDFSSSTIKLNYSPRIDFSEGLMEVINWYRENISWWESRFT